MTDGERDLYWAVIDHVRTWLGEDGPFRQMIEGTNGDIDGVTLRRISIVYNVSRGIKKGDANGDIHADAVAKLVNSQRPWPSDLHERASACLAIARDAKAKGHTSKFQASAITKFSWFSQPEGWTVYDRFVARAMNVQSQSTEARVLEFYDKLARYDFTKMAAEIQSELDRQPLIRLHGTRVLDKFMMLTGARNEPKWAENLRSINKAFIYVLPEGWRSTVESTAKRIAKNIDIARFLAKFDS